VPLLSGGRPVGRRVDVEGLPPEGSIALFLKIFTRRQRSRGEGPKE
jgi:hypothetical protein